MTATVNNSRDHGRSGLHLPFRKQPEVRSYVATCTHVLIGNSFPLSLVRRRVVITPESVPALQRAARNCRTHSYWGHPNTIRAAEETVGLKLSPSSTRPVVELNDELLPTLDGIAFTECWLVTPQFSPGYRPTVGEEVTASQVIGWHVLCMRWQDA